MSRKLLFLLELIIGVLPATIYFIFWSQLAIGQGDGKIVIKENSQGGSQVLVDGKSVWPPKGPSCTELVTCCQAFQKDSTVTLGCQLAVAKDPSNCKEALKQVKSMIQELGNSLPKECK